MLVVLVPLALPAGAFAQDDFQRIFGDYKDDGQINGCYRPHEIHNAGQGIPPDIEQYAPGFGDALATAQVQCGSGQVPSSGDAEEEASPPVISAGTPGGGAQVAKKRAVREPPAPKVVQVAVPEELAAPRIAPAAAAVAGDTPGPLVALLIAAGLAVVLALGWAIAWFMGWSPERLTNPLFAAFESLWDRVSPGR